jgi:hypothetical protein
MTTDDKAREPIAEKLSVETSALGENCSAETWPDSNENHVAEIARLATLSPLDYERERAAAAKKLGLRPQLNSARRDPPTFVEHGQALAAIDVPHRR